MFSKIWTSISTEEFLQKIEKLKRKIDTADAIVIGAGSGLSTSAGLTYDGERFMKYFSDFHEKYGIRDIYSGSFYPFDTLEEYWAWWSRHIFYNRYVNAPGKAYSDLLELVKDKNYFALTTNVDHQFQLAGFDKQHLFYTQGDYGLWQCSQPCHQSTYDNEDAIRKMIKEQTDMRIPSGMIPFCPKCGSPMTMNLRCDHTFVQDKGWYIASKRYVDFVSRNKNLNILFLELGVGENTPSIIKYPFWKMTAQNKDATYACVNLGEAVCPQEIQEQSICINGDISAVLSNLQ
ncbi:MAG: Sir2 silent information regulator family NAD-dependent deacetylase [Eubacteriales bacterium]|nr:Sir2 silent information regulator family NAD-dependent deacetylase [Eubacteriales bacterium]